MLTHLQIRDLAIIDLVDLEVRAGLTVLTGETGAGKSIVVDALALLAGGKGGAEVVRAGTERAELSATFDISGSPAALRELLKEQSVDAEDELTVRRVIAADGRSRGYLNGVSVPLQLLRDVGALIVDIHGQHEFQSLTRASAQQDLLDDFGKSIELADKVREAHKAWVGFVNRTVELEGKGRDRDSRIEMLRHQVGELKALDLKEGEVAQLAEERARHSNRGRLAEAAQAAVGLLYDSDDGNAHATASRALAGIKTLSGVDPRLAKVIPMVDEATIQIREAARELSRYLETLDIDPARQEEVERRLAAIEELSRKHRVQTAELSGRTAVLEKELAELESADNNLAALKKQQAESLDAYRKLATQLSLDRQERGAHAFQGHHGPHADVGHGRRTVSSSTSRRPVANRRPRFRRRGIPGHGQSGSAAPAAGQGGVGRRAGAAVTGRSGRVFRQGRALHWCSTKSIRASVAQWPRSSAVNSGAGLFRPGAVRDSPSAGSQPGSPSSACRQAH